MTAHSFSIHVDKHHAKKNTLRASRGRVRNDPATVLAQRAVHLAAKAAYTGPVHEGAVIVDLAFCFATDDRSKYDKPHTDTPDGPNLAALVYDALEHVCYANDKQVASTRVLKVWGPTNRIAVSVTGW